MITLSDQTKDTIIGFALGFISTLIYDYLRYKLANQHKKTSLKSYLKAEKTANLTLLNSLNDSFKKEGLKLSSDALTECLRNPALFSKKTIDSYLKLYDSITFYNSIMPTGSIQRLSLLGKSSSWNTKFKTLKDQLE